MRKMYYMLLLFALVGCGSKESNAVKSEEQQTVSIPPEESRMIGINECESVDTIYFIVEETNLAIFKKAKEKMDLYLDNKCKYEELDSYLESVSHSLEHRFYEPLGNDITFAKEYNVGNDSYIVLCDRKTGKPLFNVTELKSLIDKCQAKFIEEN